MVSDRAAVRAGSGVAGVVTAVGESVDPGWIGRRVIAYTDGGGGYAQRVAVATDGLIAVPDGLDLWEAGALLHDGNTALGLLEGTPVRQGDRVLILGAAGGMGVLLVQLAHVAGGQVIAAARGERKLALARELGAATVVNYSAPDWPKRVLDATAGAGPDVVFDGVGGLLGRAAFEIMARYGRISTHGAPSGTFTEIDPDEARRRNITVRGIEQVQGLGPAARRRVARVLAEATAGRIRPIIGQTFPMAKAADAHTAIEARNVLGKTLLLA
jgi:NADPH:quinone reductase